MSKVLRALFIISTFIGANSDTVCEAFRKADNIPDGSGHMSRIPSGDERFIKVFQSVSKIEPTQDMVLFHREETTHYSNNYFVVLCGIGKERLSWKVDFWFVNDKDLQTKLVLPGFNGNGDFASTEKLEKDMRYKLGPKFRYVRNQLTSAQAQPQNRGEQNARIMLAIGATALAGLSRMVPGRVQKWFPRAIASTNQSEDGDAQHGVEEDGDQQDGYDMTLMIGIIILLVAVIAMIGIFFFLRNKSKKRMARKMDKLIHSRNEEGIQDVPESVIVNMDNDAVPGSDDYGPGVTGKTEGAEQEMEGAGQETGQYI